MQWEYKICRVSSDRYDGPLLDYHGSQGWELVSVVAHTENGTTTHYEAFFKRPK